MDCRGKGIRFRRIRVLLREVCLFISRILYFVMVILLGEGRLVFRVK